MQIFQHSVIKRFLQSLDKEKLEQAYKVFKLNYSPEKIEKIKKLKEEEYQDGFLRDIFVDVFGYTLKPDENHDLVREFKNQADSKKADGAILIDEKAIAVIELKSTKTKDLTSITQQAFNYKNNQPGCKYVIISNFYKLRFYIDYANEYEEFDLFKLSKERFDLLYLILSKQSVFDGIPHTLKTETRFHEQDVSDKLYKDYSSFKHGIFNNLVKNNPDIDKLLLFKKSQKLLDRLLFIFFAEDSQLLPDNSISRMIERHQRLKDEDAYKPLYDIYKQYFGYMNIGRKGKTTTDDIPAYNGGLFAPDDILDNVKIDDNVLKNDSLKLSKYNFNTEVDVNILGHIFEHSLSEIEEIEKQLTENLPEAKTSKRKKDGVFYTPKYITQYIVENTIGTLCTEKRKVMQIYEIEFDDSFRTKKGLSIKGKELFAKLNAYKAWLLTLKILDPACGSGAFLNQALQFLIAEHKFMDDVIADLEGKTEALRIFDTDKAILENNLFGVDINDESVEIAKLSLWLRTAQRGRKLSILSNNIKCGNSLIDDPEIAGDKAFDWNVEFKEIKDNGGFDVVIGNPPYGAKISKSHFEFYTSHYETAHYKLDTFSLFIEKSIKLAKQKGQIGLIVPYTWLTIQQHSKLRKFVLSYKLLQIIDLPTKIFADADLDTVISIIKKENNSENIQIGIIDNSEIVLVNELSFNNIKKNLDYLINVNLSDFDYEILDKIQSNSIKLTDNFEVSQGLIPYDKYRGHTSEQIKNRVFHSTKKENETYKKELKGGDISRYSASWNGNLWISYGDWLAAPRKIKYFNSPRILIMEVTRGGKYVLKSCYVEKEFYNTPSIINIIGQTNDNKSLKYLLATMNSSLFSWYHKKVNPKANATTSIPKILVNDVRNLPYKKIDQKNQQSFIEKADLMLSLNKKLQTEKGNFINALKEDKGVEKITKNLDAFNELEYDVFKKELLKQKVKISLGDENNEWREYFNSTKQKVNDLQQKINQTDKEIDNMVYELYELTAEEIEIVENSVK